MDIEPDSPNRNLPPYIKQYILNRVEEGVKYDSIVDSVKQKMGRKISKGTITKIVNKQEEYGTLDDLPREGRRRLFTEDEEDAIVKAVENNPILTGADVFRDPRLNVHDAGIRTVQGLLKDHGLLATRAPTETLRDETLEAFFRFAEEMRKNPNIWPTIIFSDEADLFPYKSGKVFVRRYRGENPVVFYDLPQRWDTRSIKVWGCISAWGVGPLAKYKGPMNQYEYMDLLETHLLKNYPKLRGTSTRRGALSFMQDNASSHRAYNTGDWFTDHHVHVIKWPPYSPDLNPIENVWGIIEDRLYKKNDCLLTADDVWKETKRIWKTDINEYIPGLYKTMHDRMVEVHTKKGHRIDR